MGSTKRYIGTITVYAYSEEQDPKKSREEAVAKLRAMADHLNSTLDEEPSAALEKFHSLDFGSLHSQEYHLETLEKIKEDGK